MKKILILLLVTFIGYSQNPITVPSPKATFSNPVDFRNVNLFNGTLKNFNFEQLTSSQINAISNPKIGRKVYNTNTKKEMYWNGTHWASGGGSVESVNGILPDINGNISISLTNVTTGTFLNRPTTANNGDVYVVSGDANPTINGVTYISNGITWYEITPNQASLDARYLQIINAFSGNYNDLTNKPTLFSGSYNDLTNKPSLFSGDYNDLTNKPTIPTVPTLISAFTNDVGYITTNAITSVNTKTGAVILTKNDIGLSNVDNTSDIDKPISTATQNALNNKEDTITAGTNLQYWRGDKTWQTLPIIPTNVSEFTNDANYVNETQLATKQNNITLTTSGNSGASTLTGATLNIPDYTLSGLGGISLTSLSATSPITYDSATGVISSTLTGTPFALSGSNTDANNNKTSLIHRDGSVQVNNGFIRANNGTNPFYSASLEPDTNGSKINFGTNLAPSNLMIIGAYNSQNNIDNKTRDLQIFSTGFNGITYKALTGRVGVGTVSPTGNLEIQNGTSSTQLIIGNPTIGKTSASLSTSADTNGSFIIQATRTAGTSWGDIVINNSGGNVGIAKTAPTERLDVAGNIRFSGALMPNNTAGTAGQVLVSSGTGQSPVWQTIAGATPYTAGDGIIISGSNVVSVNAWVYFVQTWSVEPTKIASITGATPGDVWSYTLNGVTRFRFVPTVYDPTQDAFYTTWNAGTSTLSGLIITRG